MKVHEYREMMRYLTRKPLSDREVELAYTDHMQKLNSQAPMQVASDENFETNYNTEVAPEMVVPPQDILPKNAEPVMPSAPGIPDPKFRQIELATGGRVEFAEGTLPDYNALSNEDRVALARQRIIDFTNNFKKK